MVFYEKQALQTYKDLYDDLMVPQQFIVPESLPWPKETWGLRLGARVNSIRWSYYKPFALRED